MKREYSTTPDHVLHVSEADALTIYIALETELHRRAKCGIPNDERHRARLGRLIADCRAIADSQPCAVCSRMTARTAHVPVDGDVESGPYTREVPCCGARCEDKLYRQR